MYTSVQASSECFILKVFSFITSQRNKIIVSFLIKRLMKSEPISLGFVIYGHKEDKTCCKEFPFYCFVEAITRSGFTIKSFNEAVELSILQSLDSSLSLKLYVNSKINLYSSPFVDAVSLNASNLGKQVSYFGFCKQKNYGIIETNEQFANRCLTVCYSSCLLPVLPGLVVSRTEQVFSAITVYCSSWRPLFVQQPRGLWLPIR